MKKQTYPLLLQVLFILSLLLPWLIFLLLPGRTVLSLFFFWIAMMLCLFAIWTMTAARSRRAAAEGANLGPRMVYEVEQPAVVREVMDVRIAIEESGVQMFRGPLRESAEAAYEKLRRVFSDRVLPLVQTDEQLGAKIILMPKPAEASAATAPVRPWLHWLLFALTIGTTTWAGAAHQGVDLAREPERFTAGLPYSVGLLLILGAHELGHFYMARRHRMDVTPPYFIPVPFCTIHVPSALEIEDRPIPKPDINELVIRLGAGGICGSDFHYFGCALKQGHGERELHLIFS
jgi:hypothetical protein